MGGEPTTENATVGCRVALVDDNDITRAGFATILSDCPEVDLILAIDHRHSLGLAAEWAATDVVLVDAADEDRAGDQFPGVEVVRHIRAVCTDSPPIIIVITGHFLHDGLRYRMAEAGADFYFFRGNLRSADGLLDIVLHPDRYRRGVPPLNDADQLRLLGLAAGTNLDGLVAYVDQHHLGAALDDTSPVRHEPRGRHWLRQRKAIAAAGSIKAVNITTGDMPFRGGAEPSWRQLRRVFSWAARVRPVDDGLESESR